MNELLNLGFIVKPQQTAHKDSTQCAQNGIRSCNMSKPSYSKQDRPSLDVAAPGGSSIEIFTHTPLTRNIK
jgi:hypothetical protein